MLIEILYMVSFCYKSPNSNAHFYCEVSRKKTRESRT